MIKTLSEISEMAELDMNENSIETQEQFFSSLTKILSYLIDHHFEKLLWILYRIDVDEEKAKAILATNPPEDAPAVLAQLIIERIKKKEELKKRFNNSFLTDEDDALKW